MKKPVLVLFVFLALTPFVQLVAQEPPPAQPLLKDAVAPIPEGAQCLAIPSDGQAEIPSDLQPVPSATPCTTHKDCQTGELCCNLCGAQPLDPTLCLFCFQTVERRCPLVV